MDSNIALVVRDILARDGVYVTSEQPRTVVVDPHEFPRCGVCSKTTRDIRVVAGSVRYLGCNHILKVV